MPEYKHSIAIIGGGIMGVSLLYHLAKLGWKDLVLLEKNELTAGSTWHAAGLCTHFAHNPTIMSLRAHSVKLYRDILPEATGQSVGFHPCGALRITRSTERMHEFRQVQGLGRFTGYRFDILSPEELLEIYPLVKTDGIVGAIHEPDDGFVDPTLATQALAGEARKMGAVIKRHCQVLEISMSASSGWKIKTPEGEITAQHIVNAAGTWCREIGDMMGVDLPVVPMLHQYLVTDTVEELQQRSDSGAPELPMIRDPEESWYLRQEHQGFILGPYEKEAVPWSVDGVPGDFGMELLPADLDRVEHIVEKAMDRVPALQSAGIKAVVNGPITFTPDANPLIGPAYDLDNAWLLTGSSMGVMEGGGAGSFLAHWINDGSPPMDALAIDSRRFGDYADRDYRLQKAVECFGLQFGIHYPHEERPAARNRRVTPVRSMQAEMGAVFGCAYGWERPNWFSENGEDTTQLTFNRPGWFDLVGGECRHVMNKVGIGDLSAFSKFEIKGPDADRFLASLGANRPPRKGRVGLIHALTAAGGVASEFSVSHLDDNLYYLVSAAAAERHDADLLRQRSAGFDVSIQNVTKTWGILAIMGPHAVQLLESLTPESLTQEAFPWLHARAISIGEITVRALRVSYIGESGFELHVPMQDMAKVWHALFDAGRDLKLKPFGTYAMNSMRMEKGYRAWGMDLTTERTPVEAGLGFLVKAEQRSFVGRDALLNPMDSPWRMVLLEMQHPEEQSPFGGHTLFIGETAAGIITSAVYGHRTRKSLALAYLKAGYVDHLQLEVLVLGHRYPAHVLESPPYDPENLRMKG